MSQHNSTTNVQQINTWEITGRCVVDPPRVDWRDHLATLLGQRPRRLGTWTELAIYGARMCLDDAGEVALPRDAILRVSSTISTATAFLSALQQSQDGFLLPVSFLQSQPSQMLTALANHLNWQGDANFITSPDSLAEIRLACVEANRSGMLIGWVDDSPTMRSVWLRLVPVVMPPQPFAIATAASINDASVRYWQLTSNGVMVA